MNEIRKLEQALEILTASYFENFKYSEDLAKFLGPRHPKRIAIIDEINDMAIKMTHLSNQIKILKQKETS